MSYILAALLGYALGCLSPAYLLARRKGFDIRSTGSQNAGASNAFITMGAKSGVAVGLCDMAKSCAAALLAALLFPTLPGAAAVAGTAAVLGHIFPFYLKFRGGKGFAPFLGLTLALDWRFFLGILAAYYIARLPRLVKGVLDVVLTLPLVLPPTVVGWLLLVLLGPNRPIGAWVLDHFGLKLVMTWWSAIFATVVVAFPLMYRTARGAFESFDHTLAEAAQTLGRSNAWIFWRVRMPVCRQGILAGTVLAFARALGEYGATSMIAGYTPGRTATISTTVYQLWRTNNDAEALRWVLVNIAISAVFLLAVNLLETREKQGRKGVGR